MRASLTRRRRKGNQWYFGMKAHIGVDAESGLAHSLATRGLNHEAGSDGRPLNEKKLFRPV